MNKIFTIIAVIISLSSVIAYAETNGVWHNAEDVRPGEFASDESGGDFRFPQNVDINNNLGVGTNSVISGNPAGNSYIIGNLGVGDTTPSNQLSIESIAGNTVVGITSNGGVYSSIDFYNGASNEWGIGKDNLNNFYIDEFGVANRMAIIQGTGYVGINTYSPRAELEVDGTIIAKNLKIDNGSGLENLDDIYVNEDQPNSITSPMIVDGTIIANDISSNYYLWDRNGNDITTNLAGNVGIGTINPAAKLHIVNDKPGPEMILDAPPGDVSGIRFAVSGSDKFFIGGTEDALILGKMDPAVSNMATIFLTKQRDVGIGTGSPQAKLHVNGDILGTKMGINTNTPLDYPLVVERTNTDMANIHLIGNNQGGAPAMGRPEISFEEKSTRVDWNVFVAGSNGDGEPGSFNINIQELAGVTLHKNYFSIKSDGNIGIGTFTPQAKLHVTGNIIANNPTQNNHVATKQYVDSVVAGAGGSLNYFKTATSYFTYNHGGAGLWTQIGNSAICPAGSYLVSCTFCKDPGCNPVLTGVSIDRNYADAGGWEGQVEYYIRQTDSRTCSASLNAYFPTANYATNGWKTSIETTYGVGAWCIQMT